MGENWSTAWISLVIVMLFSVAFPPILFAAPVAAIGLAGYQLYRKASNKSALSKPYVFPAARLTFVPGHRVDTTRAFNANRSWQGTYLGHRRQRAIVHWDLNEMPTFGIDFAILEPAATKVEDSDR